MQHLFQSFSRWLSEAIAHALGNPREEKEHLPPSVGVQPFTGLVRSRF
jgi:hypothetical protein